MCSSRLNCGAVINLLAITCLIVSSASAQSGSGNFLQLFLEANNGTFKSGDYAPTTITDQCRGDLDIINEAVLNHSFWATKLMDASGRIDTAFVWGNNFWLGSKSSCARVSDPHPVRVDTRYHRNTLPNLTEIVAPISITYRMIYAKHFSPLQYDTKIYDKSTLHIGICLPTSCQSDDSMTLLQQIFNSPTFSGHDLLGPRPPQVFHSKILKLRDDFYSSPVVIACIAIFSTLLFLNVICTVINVSRKQINNHCTKKKTEKNSRECLDVEKVEEVEKKRYSKPLWDKFLTCFLIPENARIIFSTYLSPSSLPAIHGVRAISLSWIIMAHLFVYTVSNIGNLPRVFTFTGDWYMQPFNSAAIAVDTFYVLGGLLISYLHFEQQKKRPRREGIVTILKTVGNRFFRIAPSYYTVMLLAIVVGIYLNDKSQFLMLENVEENCKNYWWRNMLFINNFYPLSEMCLSWSWYLSVDFQCFTIGTVILIIWTNNKWIAGSIFSVIFMGATLYNGFLGYTLNYQFTLDVEFETINVLYTALGSRINGYFVGMICGWYLSVYERKTSLSQFTRNSFWVMSVLSLFFLVFVRATDQIPLLASMMYAGFSKIIWAASISWIILNCTTDSNGFAKRILESKILLPISRLSYSAYLVNPLIIMMLILNTEFPLLLDVTSLLYISFGIFWIVMYASVVFMMCIENPYTMMVRTFIERKV